MPQSPEDRISSLLGRHTETGWLPEDDDEELAELLPGSRPVPTRIIVAVVVALTVLGIAGFIVYHQLRSSDDGTAAGDVTQVSGAQATGGAVGAGGAVGPGKTASPTGDVTVHVVGAVRTPRVVTLPAGSRVADALSAAGGVTKKADTAAVNQARVLADGEQIIVPERGKRQAGVGAGGDTNPSAGTSGESGAQGGGAPGGGASAGSGTAVNLNTADAQALQTLPGVGPVTAEAIIAHRDEHGPFDSVDRLTDVSGIGPATLERLRPLVTV